MKPVRILLIDEQPLIRTGLKTLLGGQSGLDVVGETDHAADAVDQVRLHRPDLVIMDIDFSDRDGERIISSIRRRWPRMKVLLLTGHTEETCLYRALKAGATGYVLKHTDDEEMLRAIRTVLRGGVSVPTELVRAVVDHIFQTPNDQAPPRDT